MQQIRITAEVSSATAMSGADYGWLDWPVVGCMASWAEGPLASSTLPEVCDPLRLVVHTPHLSRSVVIED